MKRVVSFVIVLIGLAAPADPLAARIYLGRPLDIDPFVDFDKDRETFLAERGNAKAQSGLGDRYLEGIVVPQDYAAAVRWYRKAAEQGYASAQYKLGLMYNNARGVPQDYADAERWYRKAAEQGDADAQIGLGVMYLNGEGVLQDFAEAARWLRKAAKDTAEYRCVKAKALFIFGVMYDKGVGAPQDYVQAHMWFNLAAAQGHKRAAKNRDVVAEKMTSADVFKAQRLARAWRSAKRTVASKRPAPRSNPQPAPQKRTAGSGIIVSTAGHVLTNAHVVDTCRTIRATSASLIETTGISVGPKRLPGPPFGNRSLKLVAIDARVDLAILASSKSASNIATFRKEPNARTGEAVVVAGFPLPGVLTSDLNVTTGTVSAAMGPGNDRRVFQITAPVQPGNSGGPVLDTSGHVVGVVVARLDALMLAQRTGRLPQNVNFAISGTTARKFLDTHKIAYDVARSSATLSSVDIAARARGFTVSVECRK